MPTTQQAPQLKAKRIAALLAGFDTGNACEAEAISKGLALRRMAVECNTRIVDLLELPEIRRAIDDQMQPKRIESQELETAAKQAAALRVELMERTRDVRKLAYRLKKQEETAAALRGELAKVTCAARMAQAGPAKPQSNNQTVATNVSPIGSHNIGSHSVSPQTVGSHSFGAQSWVIEITVIVTALVLTFVAVFR